MKTRSTLLAVVLALSAPQLHAGDSERTADHILTTPSQFEGKQVELDVAFVQPVKRKSPVAELAFFRAFTMDRKDRKPGGAILVAVLASEAEGFSKKYGTDFEGRYEKDTLTGTLMAAPGRSPREQVWLVDTTGRAAELLKEARANLADEEAGERGAGGERGRGFRSRQGGGSGATGQ
jgi:hypothetical protein